MSIFRSVLVPVEFEALAQGERTAGEVVQVNPGDSVAVGPYTIRALEMAAQLARGGALWLVHAQHDFSDYATWIDPRSMNSLTTGAHDHALATLQVAAQRHCPDVQLNYVIEPGAVLDVVLKVARDRGAEAIVLSASSRGRINRAFHGSTADKLIRRAACPVMVLPSGTD